MQQTLSQRSDQEHLDLELLIVSEVLVQGHNCGASRSSWSQRHTDESDEDEAADYKISREALHRNQMGWQKSTLCNIFNFRIYIQC